MPIVASSDKTTQPTQLTKAEREGLRQLLRAKDGLRLSRVEFKDNADYATAYLFGG